MNQVSNQTGHLLANADVTSNKPIDLWLPHQDAATTLLRQQLDIAVNGEAIAVCSQKRLTGNRDVEIVL